jgi:hypothetical protein
VCSKSENGANRPRQKNNGSVYKGVSPETRGPGYVAQIWKDKKHYRIGNFPKERWAAMAYDLTATHPDFFGEFAYTNFTAGEIIDSSWRGQSSNPPL